MCLTIVAMLWMKKTSDELEEIKEDNVEAAKKTFKTTEV
jgi:hypothetical protein